MADDTVWLTYDDAGARLGIKAASVRRRAAARKWPRRAGNDGKARVGIPEDVIASSPSRGDVRDAGIPAATPVISGDMVSVEISLARAEIATLNTMVSSVQRELERAEADRDRWHALATAPRPGWIERIRDAVRR